MTLPPPRPSREQVAALAARAQALTAEANDLLAGAMRDAVDAAGGLSGVAVETARDVVQYLVRRGRMARVEADRLLAAAEGAAARRVAAGRVPNLPLAGVTPAEAAPAGAAGAAPARKARGAKKPPAPDGSSAAPRAPEPR